ncbi:MAG: hypothetical protein KDH19_01320 [Geminicoccaceae bacterium]|nr:hypothetical protein [Geminicoccaceae bacterium]
MDKILNGGFLAGYKTYLTALLSMITAIIAYLSGDMELQNLIQTLSTALIGAFLRAGVKGDAGGK